MAALGALSSRLGLGSSESEAEVSDAALEEELRRQCNDLERLLRQDPLSFENEALEVQLVQMQDDYSSLQEDFKSMREYFGQQIAQLSGQLEEQARAAGSAEGQADCLRDLLHFHEDQGKLAGSYWRAQCEKRDDSIRFLALKLQEYTVPSAEYRARRNASDATTVTGSILVPAAVPKVVSSSSTSTPPPSPPRCSGTGSPSPPAHVVGLTPSSLTPIRGETASSPAPSPRQGYQALLEEHAQLCKDLQEQEERGRQLESELEACQLSCAALSSECGPEMSEAREAGEAVESAETEAEAEAVAETEAEAEAECRRLQEEVLACDQALVRAADASAVPSWAHRCPWREELDIRAGQLERISMQCDTTKRSLDDANKELQWQATRAEALRMRLSDMLRAAKSEEAKAQEFRSEQQQSEGALEELLEGWGAASSAGAPPLAYQQAQCLLERFRQGEVREEQRQEWAATGAPPTSPPRGLSAAWGGASAQVPPSPLPPPVPQTPWPPTSALPSPLPPVLTWTTAGLLGPGA